MRESRLSGSEGGATHRSSLPLSETSLRASLLLLLLRQVEPALTRHGGGIRLTCIPGIHRDQDMMSIESRTEVTVVTEDSF